jgi:hypothetical protein
MAHHRVGPSVEKCSLQLPFPGQRVIPKSVDVAPNVYEPAGVDLVCQSRLADPADSRLLANEVAVLREGQV